MGCRAVETARNISNAFGPGTATEQTVQWWFKEFCKGDESLEDEECSHQPSEIGNDSLPRATVLCVDPRLESRGCVGKTGFPGMD